MTVVEDVETDVYDTCACRSDFTFSDYWNATPELQHIDLAYYASKRVLAVPVGDDDEHTPFDVLLPTQKQRLLDYRDVTNNAKKRRRVSLASVCVFDLDHNPLKRPRISVCSASALGGPRASPKSGNLNCMISHGCIWHDTYQRQLAASEWCSLHGFPTLDQEFVDGFPINFAELLTTGALSPPEVQSMMGNGWHLPSCGAWIMWLLSSIEATEDISSIPRSVEDPHVEGDPDVELQSLFGQVIAPTTPMGPIPPLAPFTPTEPAGETSHAVRKVPPSWSKPLQEAAPNVIDLLSDDDFDNV